MRLAPAAPAALLLPATAHADFTALRQACWLDVTTPVGDLRHPQGKTR